MNKYIKISFVKEVVLDQFIQIYTLNKWSSAQKTELLDSALKNSDSLVTSRAGDQLIVLGNAIGDGYSVVFFPHLWVHPDRHKKEVGKMIAAAPKEKHKEFLMLMHTADIESVSFYKKKASTKTGHTQSMWIYK